MVSVLIVNWNTRSQLRECLRSLEQYPATSGQQIIVVDNASTDGSADMVAGEFPCVALIRAPRNLGYAAGNNLAAGMAEGDYLLMLNPDTEVFRGSLDECVARLEAWKTAGSAAAQLVGTDGKLQQSVRGFPSWIGILGDATGLGRRLPGSRLDSYRLSCFDYTREQLAPQPMGTFLMFRRSALAAIDAEHKPFDEAFPIFFNEVDLLARLKAASFECVYCPSVKIKHHGGLSTKQVRKSMIWESHRSLLRYMRKHDQSVATRWFFPFLAAIVLIGAFVRARGYDAGFAA